MRALVVSILAIAVIAASWGIFVNYSDKNIHKLEHHEEDIPSALCETGQAASFHDFQRKCTSRKRLFVFFNTKAINYTDFSMQDRKTIFTQGTFPCIRELNSIKKSWVSALKELITLDNVFLIM